MSVCAPTFMTPLRFHFCVISSVVVVATNSKLFSRQKKGVTRNIGTGRNKCRSWLAGPVDEDMMSTAVPSLDERVILSRRFLSKKLVILDRFLILYE